MNDNLRHTKILEILTYGMIATLLLLWGMVHIQEHMNHDIAYLTNSAIHMINGERMSEAYYEVNPPLSIIVYIPSAIMNVYAKIPIYYGVFIQSLILTVISSIFVFLLLKKTPWLKEEEKLLLISTYALVNTVMTGYEFGQKDQYIILFLFPLALLMFLTTYNIKISSILKWSILIAGGIFILLKPHYGLIPAAIFIHRGIIQKRFTVIVDKDFICLGALFFIYIAIILTFFYDYVSVMLPDILKLYVSDIYPEVVLQSIHYAIIISLFIAFSTVLSKKTNKIIVFLFLMSLISLVPFVMQGKGADYHTIPLRTFFLCALSLFLMQFFFFGFKYISIKYYSSLGMFSALLIILLIIYPYFTRPLARMSHNEYKQTQIVKILQQCSNSDAVFIYDGRAYITQLAPIYAGKTHASRFVWPWFMKDFLNTKQENFEIIKKYGDMMAQDFNKYEPGIILLSPVKYLQPTKEPFDFKSYFSKYSDEFAAIWNNYDLVEEVIIDRTPYLAKENEYNIGTYKVYRNKKCDIK